MDYLDPKELMLTCNQYLLAHVIQLSKNKTLFRIRRKRRHENPSHTGGFTKYNKRCKTSSGFFKFFAADNRPYRLLI